MNTNTITLTLDNGWKIEAEHDGEKYHLDLESRDGKYYGSLAQAEDTGYLDSYGELPPRKVPNSVLSKALELEDKLYEQSQA